MSKPVFKPGDILTADAINNYLVENSQEQLTVLQAAIDPRIQDITARIAEANRKAQLIKNMNQGGKPTYDYENV